MLLHVIVHSPVNPSHGSATGGRFLKSNFRHLSTVFIGYAGTERQRVERGVIFLYSSPIIVFSVAASYRKCSAVSVW
jgi:hypothetical protein